jgi:2-C-methyl-D-erythritol 4-phosphate cytidylyltransferase
MAVALIVAAGRGERLGSGKPKALLALAGKPMLQWSVDALSRVRSVDEIVVAMPADSVSEAPPGTVGVTGGAVRSESVRLALQAAGGGDPVIVHDAARPVASTELFERALNELAQSGADAVIAASPVSDTIKEVSGDGRTVARTLDRSRLWAVQTPQVFRRAVLQRALEENELLPRATDDAWLVEQIGGTVRVVESSSENIKVTDVTDLRLAELLLVG